MKKISNMKYCFLILAAIFISLMAITPVIADNVVKLKVLVIATGAETEDPGLSYIKPILDEMGVPYDILNASTQDLTVEMLASTNGVACGVLDSGCVGNYNGIILTLSDLASNFTPTEWDILHNYEKDFHVREAVLSGWPGTYWDPNSPWGIYLDYGLTWSSSGNSFNAQWSIPAASQKAIFEYVNQTNPLPITDFAFAANPHPDPIVLRDGSSPSVIPLLKTQNNEALVSIVQYMMPSQTTPVREVMISTITHASFLIHSQVLAYEFVNWVTQGVFVGSRFIHMAAHLDDLFIANTLWDPENRFDSPSQTYRLNSTDITNAVSKQADFRATHPTADAFKLDFPFNGSGAVIDPLAKTLVPNLTEDLVAAVVANKDHFRFINHTYTHADMDKAPVPANPSCDYDTFTTVATIQAEITKNRTVWGLLGLPERAANNRVLLTGNHSGLKDRKCTDYPSLHLEMVNVQSDDVEFDQGGANPLFLKAAANAGVDYLASDSSQRAQNIEQYITQYDDGSAKDRLMLPRWPTNIFVNVTNPALLVAEYNYIFHDRFADPCSIPGAICNTRTYAEILAAEAENALRHMLTLKKWPHFFHQSNLAKYDENGNTLQFDWLNAVFTEYERLFKLPVKNFPYYLIGDKTKNKLNAKAAIIEAKWDRTTKKVTLLADRNISGLQVTGISNGELYGGQLIREINLTALQPKVFVVNQALSQ